VKIDPESGLLADAELHLSPNCDERPDRNDITGVVIHNISLPPGEFAGEWIDDLFLNKLDRSAHPYFEEIADLRVSAHLLIRRNGKITQYVPFHQRAWHAGESRWQGRDRCNDFTIGIEVEGCDYKPFEQKQYDVLTQVLAELIGTYPELDATRIVGHQHISPGRKTDPGPYFDWEHLFAELKVLLVQAKKSRL
jgi:AmpD protein